MIGGDRAVVARLDPIFRTLAPGLETVPRTPGRERSGSAAEHGYLYCGPSGAGHFVKMVHNGIEYGLMQAYAEGLDIMKNANSKDLPAELRYDLDLADIAELWRRGSVVSSWLLDLTAQALAENPTLSAYTGVVADSGEGRWTRGRTTWSCARSRRRGSWARSSPRSWTSRFAPRRGAVASDTSSVSTPSTGRRTWMSTGSSGPSSRSGGARRRETTRDSRARRKSRPATSCTGPRRSWC